MTISRFVHSIRIKFKGGTGGDGCISMMSLFANEFAGPDGGNGGNGGHVVLKANKRIKSFNSLARQYQGLSGSNGMGKHRYSSNAKHLFVDVPVGTIVARAKSKELAEHEFDPEESDIVADLDQEDSMFIAARGGAGGRGNATFLSNLNRHPRLAEAGAKGEVNVYELRMRLYAHVGLIGLPNVGKSTLLNALTHAKVKIGNYSFTTLYPQVGILEYGDDYTQIAISDLPGLIEESHKNRGLGLKFLRHVEHCVCLLYVVDLTSDPVVQLETLFEELELYKKGLSHRPNMIIGNKLDALGNDDNEKNVKLLKDYIELNRPGTKFLTISSLRGDNLENLRLELRRMYDEYQEKHRGEPEDALTW